MASKAGVKSGVVLAMCVVALGACRGGGVGGPAPVVSTAQPTSPTPPSTGISQVPTLNVVMEDARLKDARDRERAKDYAGALAALRTARQGQTLATADAWSVAVDEVQKQLADRVARASAVESEARTGEAQQRATVATRKADAQVVEKDRAKWTEKVHKDAQAREEEEAQEAWRPKQG